jgi:serine/threonine-protein kinase
VVHRDLKPSNALLTADGTPKITDFGVAKHADSGITLTGEVLGTPSYMAPEQAQGKAKDVGPPADIYALGAILYELLTGRPPFRGVTTADTLRQVLEDEPIPPRCLRPEVPRDLETICLKCLEKDPCRRYASAEALADDLHCHLKGDAIAARPPRLLGRFDRWARQRPALVALWISIVFFYLNHLLLLVLGAPNEGGDFHWFVTAVAAIWALGAAGFQWLLSRTRRRLTVTCGWAAFDVSMFTLVLLCGRGPRSALLPAYLLLIAGTTLRLRIGLIWFVTGLCLLSYLTLVAEAAWRRPQLLPDLVPAMAFAMSMFFQGLIQHLLLRWVRSAMGNESRARFGGRRCG